MGSDRVSKRQQKKLDAARGVAGPGTEIFAYGTGNGHARMSKGLIGLIVGFGLIFAVVLVAVHVVLIPGVVLVVVALGLIRPKRGVAVTPEGVLLFHESIWNGRPNRLILSSPTAALSATGSPSTGTSRVSLLLGNERITLKQAEFEPLLRAAALSNRELPAD
jgi:hypothetical protein